MHYVMYMSSYVHMHCTGGLRYVDQPSTYDARFAMHNVD